VNGMQGREHNSAIGIEVEPKHEQARQEEEARKKKEEEDAEKATQEEKAQRALPSTLPPSPENPLPPQPPITLAWLYGCVMQWKVMDKHMAYLGTNQLPGTQPLAPTSPESCPGGPLVTRQTSSIQLIVWVESSKDATLSNL
jgi:hypothetical protein